jgi:hypothetical protein
MLLTSHFMPSGAGIVSICLLAISSALGLDRAGLSSVRGSNTGSLSNCSWDIVNLKISLPSCASQVTSALAKHAAIRNRLVIIVFIIFCERRAHAPPVARARVAHRLKVVVTESHQNKAATGGCVTRLVLPYPLPRFTPSDKIEIHVCNLKARSSSRESNSQATSKLRTSRESGSTPLSRKALRSSRGADIPLPSHSARLAKKGH